MADKRRKIERKVIRGAKKEVAEIREEFGDEVAVFFVGDVKNTFLTIRYLNLIARFGPDGDEVTKFLAKNPNSKAAMKSTLRLFRNAQESNDLDDMFWELKCLIEGFYFWRVIQKYGRNSKQEATFLEANPRAEDDLQMFQDYAMFNIWA